MTDHDTRCLIEKLDGHVPTVLDALYFTANHHAHGETADQAAALYAQLTGEEPR